LKLLTTLCHYRLHDGGVAANAAVGWRKSAFVALRLLTALQAEKLAW